VAGKTWDEWADQLSLEGKPGLAEAMFRVSRDDPQAARALLRRALARPTPASVALLKLSDHDQALRPALEKMLSAPEPDLKGLAEELLFRLGRPGPRLDALVKKAQGGDKEAMAALASRRAAPSPDMISLLDHSDVAIRSALAASWLRLGRKHLKSASSSIAAALLRRPEDASFLVPLLVRGLGRDDTLALLQRGTAMVDPRILAEVPRPQASDGPPRDLASRIRGATDEEREELGAIFRSGRRVEDPGSQADIFAALKEVPAQEDLPGRPSERSLLMRWLALYGSPVGEEMREPLTRLLKSKQQNVRTEAAMALARLGSRDKAVLNLLTLAAEKYPTPEDRRDAVLALALFGPAAASSLEDLESYARDRAGNPRAAGAALAAIGKPAFPVLLKLLADARGAASACEAIALLGPKAEGALEPLLKAYKAAGGEGVTPEREPYARALASFGPAAAEIAPGLRAHLEKMAAAGKFDASAFHSLATLVRVAGLDEKCWAATDKLLAAGADPAWVIVALSPAGEKLRPHFPILLKAVEKAKVISAVSPGGDVSEAFARLGPWAIEALADTAAKSAPATALLGHLGKEAVPVLEQRLKSMDPAARLVALAYFTSKTGPIEALKALLQSQEDDELALVVRALARAGLKDESLFRKVAEGSGPLSAVQAIRSLRELGKPHEKAAERLKVLLKGEARAEAALELAHVKIPALEATVLLYPLLPLEEARIALEALAPEVFED
jgi:hypothetical protein